MDAADATSSGAPGDSNAILRQLLAAGYRGKALIPIVDAAAVAAAWQEGVGGCWYEHRRSAARSIRGGIGLWRSPPRFAPSPFRWPLSQRDPSAEWVAGRTAVLQAGNIILVVTSRPVHLFDRSLFHAHGQDPRAFDLVVVKSPHCQRHMFADWCARLINVDAPGATSANLRSLGHTLDASGRCFPLDEAVPFVPQAKVFTRM